MKAIFTLVCSCTALLLLPVTALSQSERRIALIMGVSDYNAGGQLRPLRGIDVDVQTVGTAATTVGFEVTKVMNPTLIEAEDAVSEFGRKLKEANKTHRTVGMFYFSGHGTEVDGKNYLMPKGARIDGPRDAKERGLGVNIVLNRMTESGGDVNLLFLDCCRSEVQNSSDGVDPKAATVLGLARMEAKGVFIGFATDEGRDSLGTSTGSPYTMALGKYMTQKGISVLDMHTFVTSEVKDVAKSLNRVQVPFQYSGLDRPFKMVPGEPDGVSQEALQQKNDEIENLKRKYEADMAALRSSMAASSTSSGNNSGSSSSGSNYVQPSYSPWVISSSSSRYLTDADLQNLSAEELWKARNEIYARHGLIFTTSRGKSYANTLGTQYYQGVSSNQATIESDFNVYEKYNVIKIKSYESR